MCSGNLAKSVFQIRHSVPPRSWTYLTTFSVFSFSLELKKYRTLWKWMRSPAYVKLVELCCTFRLYSRQSLTCRWGFIILDPFCSSLFPCNGFWFIWRWDQTSLLCIIRNLHKFSAKGRDGKISFMVFCYFTSTATEIWETLVRQFFF